MTGCALNLRSDAQFAWPSQDDNSRIPLSSDAFTIHEAAGIVSLQGAKALAEITAFVTVELLV